MEFLFGIATSVITKAAEYTVKPVCRQLGYLFYYKSNLDNLQTQIQELGNSRDRLQHRIDEARRKSEEIEADVVNWLSNIDRIKQESEDFLGNGDHVRTRCSNNWSLPNMVSRHQLSKKAKKMVQVVMSEILKAEKFEKVSYCPPIEYSVENRGYEAFDSRLKTLRLIMLALKGNNVRMIGIYGMGGIGKTMLAKEVARKAKEEKLFNKVAITTVSQTPNIESIQHDIAEQVGLKEFSNIKSEFVRAGRLRRRLSQEKNILIVLDDLWSELDLSAVGIDFADDQKGCKILLTSRSLNIVQDSMGAEMNIEIKVLSDAESTDLFKKNIGASIENICFQLLTKDIVKECAGLPIAISTVAHALKNKSLLIWKDALVQLQRCAPTNIEGMHQKVYSSIKLSYNFLEGEEAKSLLLLSSLHKEDANIEVEDLMIYGFGWGLFQEIYTIEEARNRVCSLVGKLKACCLLLEGDYYGMVKMHDVIRDVMMSIASEERRMHTIADVNKFEELLTKKRLGDSTAISIFASRTNKFPKRLECLQLEIFLSFNTDKKLQIVDQYFERKKELKVLYLSRTHLESLPTSFCSLQNLQALCLYDCNVGDISLIGEIELLKILDLGYSDVEELPKQMGQLTHLKLLNLRFCRYLKVIQPGVISSLTRLEELNMEGVPMKWDENGVNGERCNASLIELKNLLQLTTLYISVQTADIMPKDLFISDRLKRYEISIGETSYGSYEEDYKFLNLNCLHLNLSESNMLGTCGLKMIVKKSEVLYLYGFAGVKNIVDQLDKEGFPQLKSFGFESNDEIQCVVEQIHPCSAFQNLERLCLVKLMNLEKICDGKLSAESFGKLRFITVRNCDRLKNLFSSSIARRFEKIEVIECKTMREITTPSTKDGAHASDDNATAIIEFPQLRSLTLVDLPEFIQFFGSGMDLETANTTSSSDSPLPLFSKTVVVPCLEELELSDMKFKDLCSDILPTLHFQNLTRLSVNKCNGLKYLFSFAIARSFVQLVRLWVEECSSMEEVLMTEEQAEGRSEKISFPKLKSLWLRRLPKLEKFCVGDAIEFPRLTRLIVQECPRLRTLITSSISKEINPMAQQPLFNEKVIFPDLEELFIDGRHVLNEIWHRRSSMVPFSTLKYLRLIYNQEKSAVFSFKFIQKFENLENLSLLGGDSVEELSIHQENDATEEPDWTLARLKELQLWHFPNLKHLFEDLEKAKPDKAFQTIEALEVSEIGQLEHLLPFLDAFKNLKDLRVLGCPAMINVLVSSTAKSLPQLTRMSIENCKQMREIIASKEGEIMDEIVFSRLRILVLHNLPSLQCFYPGNSAMTFPVLDKLFLSQCPEMRSFSNGIVTAQKLNRIIIEIVNEDVWERMGIDWYLNRIEFDSAAKTHRWEGDINLTVQKVWEDDSLCPRDLFTEV